MNKIRAETNTVAKLNKIKKIREEFLINFNLGRTAAVYNSKEIHTKSI